MTRKVTIGVVKCDVSKNEAKEAARLVAIYPALRLRHFRTWHDAAPTAEAKARRTAVGLALGLKV